MTSIVSCLRLAWANHLEVEGSSFDADEQVTPLAGGEGEVAGARRLGIAYSDVSVG